MPYTNNPSTQENFKNHEKPTVPSFGQDFHILSKEGHQICLFVMLSSDHRKPLIT